MKSTIKVVFLHGLESDANSSKAKWLKENFDAWCPAMDYKNPNTFKKTYERILEFQPDLLIGSSMGGWFAYCLSTLTGINTLLLNPALHSRSIEPSIMQGKLPAKHTIVLGKNDDVINPLLTVDWFKRNGIGSATFKFESNNHRTPTPIMTKHINFALIESVNERKLPDFKYAWTITSTNKGNSTVQFKADGDDYVVKFNSLGSNNTLCFFESDKLKSSKNGNNSLSEVYKVLSTVKAIIEEYLKNNSDRVVYFVGAAAPGENLNKGELSKRGRVYLDVMKDNNTPGFHWKMSKDSVGILMALEETPLTESVNEEWSTESPGNAFISPLGEQNELVYNLKQNFLASRPVPGRLTLESQIGYIKNQQNNLTPELIRFTNSVAKSPSFEFYNWLVLRGERVKKSFIDSIWEDPKLIELIDSLKNHYKIPRPYKEFDIEPLSGCEVDSYSFPSGHAFAAYVMASELAKKYPHLEDGLFNLANKISMSRVMAGVHYPSDIEASKELANMYSKKM